MHFRRTVESRLGTYGEVLWPEDAAPPILRPAVRAVLHQWLYELNYTDALRAVDVRPRHRVMLSGPPGCGKTTLAHHVAARVGVPLLVVQAADMITKYVGETEQKIGHLFRAVRAIEKDGGEVAVFFDELDSLAHARMDASSSGGLSYNNIAITLLQSIDRYTGLLFAATNRAQAIDPAIWRRFQLQIDVGLPGQDERFAIVRRYIAPYAAADDVVDFLARAFDQASPALIREIVEQIKRELVLAPKLDLPVQLPAQLRRIVAAISAAPDQPVPALWGTQQDALMRRAILLPWPPMIGARDEAA